jgi:hypothetical protein
MRFATWGLARPKGKPSYDRTAGITFEIREATEEAYRTYPRKPVITQNFGCKEPKHKLPTEERSDEIRNLWRSLAVILCVRLRTYGVCIVKELLTW